MLTVERSITIDRPADLVAAQFADVAHHERTGVHDTARFAVIEDRGDECVYEQRSRIGPRWISQTMVLDRHDPRHLVNRVTAGAFRGATLTFDVDESAPASTHVAATLRLPPSLTTRLLGPVLRRAVGRELARALDEDRDDLESGHYVGEPR